jgi:hypothetical protein
MNRPHLVRDAAKRAQWQCVVCAHECQPQTNAAVDGNVMPSRVKLDGQCQPQVHLSSIIIAELNEDGLR